jgi:hypothetical protein
MAAEVFRGKFTALSLTAMWGWLFHLLTGALGLWLLTRAVA